MTGRVGVVSRYFKREAAIAVMDHANALRNGFTRSQNVIPELSHNNVGFYYSGAKSSREAFDLMCDKYKSSTGKKCRSDFNALFEHILVFSEETYTSLEQKYGKNRIKQAMLEQLKKYAEEIKQQYGFEPLGIDFHFDEGTKNSSIRKEGEKYSNKNKSPTSNIRRNIHCHISFFNYDFSKKVAPLRHLMKKGLDKNGRTNQLNPHFVKFQDIAGDLFSRAGFHRGVSKNITGREHMEKEQFVKHKLNLREMEVARLELLDVKLNQAIKIKSRKAIIAISKKSSTPNSIRRSRKC
jgi:hypothetical protein